MDALTQQNIQLVQSKQKNAVPWQLDAPYHQSFYVFQSSSSSKYGSWCPVKEIEESKSTGNSLKTLALYSWNIDFMLPFPDSRMHMALRHLQNLVERQQSPTATIIFFAECLASDLKIIAGDIWVQHTFHITDLDTGNWQSGHYGTTILIDKRLPIKSCFRVHFSKTRMERDGFFVDVKLDDVVVRVCNTHLESLALDPPLRPHQISLCAEYLHDKNIFGSIAAGDFNAIQDFDKNLHSENNLKDAYLELGGEENDAENGHTWGQQAATVQRERFGTSRMDKIYYCGNLKCLSFERFGAGVEVQDPKERKILVNLGFDRPWITDHLGVKGVFQPIRA
ncbi:hypothetical protein M433DRAFT_157205 [Acidomyces richmondensis BFW]|nr:MAG: hypothetical protein FE78DRAFT_94476 [Acidomyces sp. 'richmondensis']KYG43038.1 hypothetical protein M433DRAFT_157205 [Acidomyces richmondensis BFW]